MSNAVSYSRVQKYKKCPASYEWSYVLGNPGKPSGPAAARGTRIHKSIEDFHNNVDSLDEEIPFKMAEYLNRYYVNDDWTAHPELEFCFTKAWEPTGFDAEDGYIRGYMDGVWVHKSGKRVEIDEYKTGREYPEHAEQKALYGLAAMLLYPDIPEVKVTGVYLDKKKLVPTTYIRPHMMAMKLTWDKDIHKMSLPIYPARPGLHCRYCTKSMKEGGPCRAG